MKSGNVPVVHIHDIASPMLIGQQWEVVDPRDQEPDWDQVAAIMREAISKSRGYASYWEWAPNRSLAEIAVAKALADYLVHSEGCSWASVSPVSDDPPDVLLLRTSGERVGVEVTELVDADTIKRHRDRKKRGTIQAYDWADWTIESLTSSIVAAIQRKDGKLASRAGQYDELIVAIATDEPMISLELARQALQNSTTRVHTIHRAFLLLSYDPAVDKATFPEGIPVLPVRLQTGL